MVIKFNSIVLFRLHLTKP